MAKIRKGDTVRLLAGKDKKKSGKIIKVFPEKQRAIVNGLNLVKKHRRPRKAGEKGEKVEVSSAIHISNLILICPHCKKNTKIGFRFTEGLKLRYCKKCQGVL